MVCKPILWNSKLFNSSSVSHQSYRHLELNLVSSSYPFGFLSVKYHESFEAHQTLCQFEIVVCAFLSLSEVYVLVDEDLSPLPEVIPAPHVVLNFLTTCEDLLSFFSLGHFYLVAFRLGSELHSHVVETAFWEFANLINIFLDDVGRCVGGLFLLFFELFSCGHNLPGNRSI